LQRGNGGDHEESSPDDWSAQAQVIRARPQPSPWKQGGHVESTKGAEVHASPSQSRLLTMLIIAIILSAGALVWTNRAIIGQLIDTLDGSQPPSLARHP
jgi:hypothetical protein